MKIAMACDHGGFHLKEHIKKYLEDKGIEVVDHGTYSEDSVDYPDYAAKLCEDGRPRTGNHEPPAQGCGLSDHNAGKRQPAFKK